MFFGFDLIQAIEALGYPGIFAIVLAESGLFFGVSLPGGSLLFTSGLLASQGYLNIYILLAVILTAAILGDTIGYWFGAWVGPALYRRKDSRFFKQSHLDQARSFFDEHGAKAILLGRFVPIVRTFVPIVAGVVRMDYRTFLFYNFLGAIVWGGGFTLLGYFLGEAVPDIEKYIVFIVLGIMVVTFIPFFLHVLKQRKGTAVTKTAAPRAVIFDLDDTLSESGQPPLETVLNKLVALSSRVPVAIISGASFERIERDVGKRLALTHAHHGNFYVFPETAAQCHHWKNNAWEMAYHFPLPFEERESIKAALNEVVAELRLYESAEDVSWVVERETSIAFVGVVKGASQAEKKAWDPDGKKRLRLANALQERLPGYEVRIGGSTTIDITRKGMTKAYGVEWLANELNIHPNEMLFIGDAFYEGGNDAVVIPTGIQIHATSGPEETEQLIDKMLDG